MLNAAIGGRLLGAHGDRHPEQGGASPPTVQRGDERLVWSEQIGKLTDSNQPIAGLRQH